MKRVFPLRGVVGVIFRSPHRRNVFKFSRETWCGVPFEASSSRRYAQHRTLWRTLELFSDSHCWLFSDARSRAQS